MRTFLCRDETYLHNVLLCIRRPDLLQHARLPLLRRQMRDNLSRPKYPLKQGKYKYLPKATKIRKLIFCFHLFSVNNQHP